MSSDGTIVDTVVNKAMVPTTLVPVPGKSGHFWYSADLRSHSNIFGTGQSRSIGEFEGNPQLGQVAGELRQLALFEDAPASATSVAKCNNYDPLRKPSKNECKGMVGGALVGKATMYYLFDFPASLLNGAPQWTMQEAYNTLEFRTECFNFFKERYGIKWLDPTNPGMQVLTSDGGLPQPDFSNVQALMIGQNSNMGQAYGVDIQSTVFEGIFPSTNVRLNGNAFSINILQETTFSGGSIGNITLSPYGSSLTCANVELMSDDGNLITDYIEKTYLPTTGYLVPGLAGFRVVNDFIASSKMLGEGRGMSTNTIDFAEDRVTIRISLLFDDTLVKDPTCRNYSKSKAGKTPKGAKTG
jgi:hypothetical protein